MVEQSNPRQVLRQAMDRSLLSMTQSGIGGQGQALAMLANGLGGLFMSSIGA